MQTHTKTLLTAVGLTVALAAGCATTEMTSTWTDPAAKGAPPLSKVAVLCMTKDPGLRRQAEDAATSQLQLKGAQAIASYQIIGDDELKDREAVKAKLQNAGVDGVLVMRMTGVTEQAMVAGPYATFDGYYDYGAAVYGPGYVQTDTIVHAVSNLYSLPQNKLIWSGTSKTFDPGSATQFMGDVSKEVAQTLQKNRLIL